MSLLDVKGLGISLKKDNRALVCDLSFGLDEGHSLTLIGQSGCGKTMTCSAVMDLLSGDLFRITGEVVFDGKNLRTAGEKEKRRVYGKDIVYIPQNPMTALDPSMRVGKQMDEILKVHSDLQKNERNGVITDALESTGLKETGRILKSYPYMLSGGMLQRILIAVAVMTKARLVIADEPTTALDVVHRNETVDAFIALRTKGAGILFVTHDFAAALRMGGRVLVMQGGRTAEEGNIEEVYGSPSHDYTKQLIAAAELSGGNNALR